TLDEAVGYKISWPMDKVILDKDPNCSEDLSMARKVNIEDARYMIGPMMGTRSLLKVSCALQNPKTWL
ncbi:unnamed protein product, partial [Brassica oleracea var. botrytis]